MTITMAPTGLLYMIDDKFPVRAWEGVTDRGTKVRVFVVAIRTDADADQAEFDGELRSLPGIIISADDPDPEWN